MREIILDLTLTLDGYIEGPKGEIDWIVDDDTKDFGDVLTDILEGVDTIFYGRLSYELWGNYRPEDNSSQKIKAAYDLLHGKNKYVFSTSKNFDRQNVITVKDNIKEQVQHIQNQPGKNIWLYGGSSLTTTFINLGLIDIYRLTIQPVILGAGKKLFHDIKQRTDLKLIETRVHATGAVTLIYGH